ncbi:TPA: hypothetical protein O2V65_002849, partial [Staphylococcus aureus]|nr:hypothetical protein [Staphylococcus aureus]HDK9256657.1 hypothetical protein [Staphylococcus aureus USA100-NRS382]HBE8033240.1 hypothetical protein [Staphylococcus aureus]HCD5034510.1 hypothetical protein [Staphylococcus aureus]HCD9049247.1 hypothetical protein [Staphylococcus aureus]
MLKGVTTMTDSARKERLNQFFGS